MNSLAVSVWPPSLKIGAPRKTALIGKASPSGPSGPFDRRPACEPINGQVELDYTIRHVAAKAETLMEGDDHIWSYENETIGNEIVLVSPGDLARSTWTVLKLTEPGKEGSVIHLLGDDGEGFALTFADLREAENVLAWLRVQKPDRLAGYQLYLGAVIPEKAPVASGNSVFERLAIRTNPLNHGTRYCRKAS
jgi:hypothetical protein